MRPVLFELELPLLGQVSFPSYLTLVLAGFLIAAMGARRAARKAGLDGERMVDLALLCLALGLVGARLMAVLTDGELTEFVHLCTDPAQVSAAGAPALCESDAQCGGELRCNLDARAAVLAGERGSMCHPPRDCLAALAFWRGGLTFYGALLVAIPGAIWYCRRKRLDFLRMADVAAPYLLLGQAIGRIGCFLDGCCYGAATDGPLGVHLPGHPGPLHPTQLYEAAADLALAALLALILRPRARGRGELLGWMLLTYGAARAAIELWRADPRGAVGPLSTSQLIAIPAVAVGVWLVARARRGGQPPAEPVQ